SGGFIFFPCGLRKKNRPGVSENSNFLEDGGMKKKKKYSPEFRERAVWMVFEAQREHEAHLSAIVSIGRKNGCTLEDLRKWVRQAERDQGKRPGLSSSERD